MGKLSNKVKVSQEVGGLEYLSLREQEELFRNAFSSNASAMYVATYPDGIIVEANTSFEKLTGYTKDGALGRTTKDLNLWSAQGRKTIYAKLEVEGFITDHDTYFYTKGRAKRSCLVSVALVGNGNKKRIFVSFVDTTIRNEALKALKDSEEKFRFMAEGINDVISLHKPDMNATITYISPAIEQLTGYKPSDLVNRSPEIIVFRDDWIDVITNANLRLYTATTAIELVEYRVVDVRGTIHWAESTLKPVYGENGAVESVIAVSRDVSQRKATEQQLKELNSMKDKFLSIIAHDLKNPFNALLGFSSLLLNDLVNLDVVKIREYVTEMHAAAAGGVKLLDELLQWALVQSGSMTFLPEQVNLSEVTAEVFELASIQAATKHLYLVDNVSDKLAAFADRRMVATILRNLVTNAIKFTKPGGLVKVSASQGDRFVTITVSDSGVGLLQQDIDKLFRIDVKPTDIGVDSSGKGTGLGLILCDEFVRRNGGTIAARSVFGQGAEFTFTLPLSSPH